jgi:hypothetical protein
MLQKCATAVISLVRASILRYRSGNASHQSREQQAR